MRHGQGLTPTKKKEKYYGKAHFGICEYKRSDPVKIVGVRWYGKLFHPPSFRKKNNEENMSETGLANDIAVMHRKKVKLRNTSSWYYCLPPRDEKEAWKKTEKILLKSHIREIVEGYRQWGWNVSFMVNSFLVAVRGTWSIKRHHQEHENGFQRNCGNRLKGI